MTQIPPNETALLSKAIESLDRKVSEGFGRVERRMDDMVTRGQFDATVERLDAKDAALEERIDNGFHQIRSELTSGFENLDQREKEATKRTRWVLGWSVTVGSVLVAAVLGTLNLIF